MIGDLITQLTHERRSEIEKAGQCEADLAESARKIESANNEVVKSSTDKVSLESKMESKAKEIDEKTSFLQESDKSLAELTAARSQESAANAKAIRELEEGSAALSQAISVLQDYYSKAAEAAEAATSFLQQPLNADFEPSKGYGGSDASEGILSMLTQIETDMRSVLVETETSEKKSAEDFVLEERELTNGTAAARADLNTYKGQIAQMQQDLTDTKETLEQASDALKKEEE